MRLDKLFSHFQMQFSQSGINYTSANLWSLKVVNPTLIFFWAVPAPQNQNCVWDWLNNIYTHIYSMVSYHMVDP